MSGVPSDRCCERVRKSTLHWFTDSSISTGRSDIFSVDTIEDFRMFESKPPRRQTQRRSMLRALISNPRNSTFRQVDGYQFNPYQPPPVVSNINTIPILSPPPPTYTEEKQLRPISQTLDTPPPRLPSPIAIFHSQQRVIVREGRNRAPTLYMRRVSEIDVVNALETAKTLYDDEDGLSSSPPIKSIRSNPRDSGIASIYYTTPLSPIQSVIEPPIPYSSRSSSARHTIAGFGNMDKHGSRFFRTHRVQPSSPTLPRHSTYSVFSSKSESLSTIHALAMQFPGLPPRSGPKKLRKSNPHVRSFLAMQSINSERGVVAPFPSATLSRSASERSQRTLGAESLVRRGSSVKRKPVPQDLLIEAELDLKKDEQQLDVIDIKPLSADPEQPKDKESPMEVIVEKSELDSNESHPLSNVTHGTNARSVRTLSTRSDRPMAGIPSLPSSLPTPSSRLSFASQSTNIHGPPSRRATQLAKNRGMLHFTPGKPETRKRTSRVTLEFPWHGSDVSGEAEQELQAAREMNGLGRIKSVGRAPRKKTPDPILVTPYRRESILVECFDDGASMTAEGTEEGFTSAVTVSDPSTGRTGENQGSNVSSSVEVGQSFLSY